MRNCSPMQNTIITPALIGKLVEQVLTKLGSENQVLRFKLYSMSFELVNREGKCRRLEQNAPPALLGAELPLDSLCALVARDLNSQVEVYPEVFHNLTEADLWADLNYAVDNDAFGIGIHARENDILQNDHPTIITQMVEVSRE